MRIGSKLFFVFTEGNLLILKEFVLLICRIESKTVFDSQKYCLFCAWTLLKWFYLCLFFLTCSLFDQHFAKMAWQSNDWLGVKRAYQRSSLRRQWRSSWRGLWRWRRSRCKRSRRRGSSCTSSTPRRRGSSRWPTRRRRRRWWWPHRRSMPPPPRSRSSCWGAPGWPRRRASARRRRTPARSGAGSTAAPAAAPPPPGSPDPSAAAAARWTRSPVYDKVPCRCNARQKLRHVCCSSSEMAGPFFSPSLAFVMQGREKRMMILEALHLHFSCKCYSYYWDLDHSRFQSVWWCCFPYHISLDCVFSLPLLLKQPLDRKKKIYGNI